MTAVAGLIAARSPAAEPLAEISPQSVRERLDAADQLLKEGKPGKAASRVAEAAAGIEQLADEGIAVSGLRSLWERCRSLRATLELEGVDVEGIRLAPLKSAAGKPQAKASAKTPAKVPAKVPASAKTPVQQAVPAAAGKPVGKPAATFTAQVAPILSRHCGGCHIAGRKGGFQMASYAGLMKSGMVQPGVGESSRLVEVILSGDMPRGGGKVAPDDVGILMKWIDAGAPFDGPDPTAPIGAATGQNAAMPPPAAAPAAAVSLKPGDISFSAEVAPVLVEHCSGCHDADQPEGGFGMVTFERLLRGGRGGTAVVAGKGAESLLVKKLKGMGIEGQRMPLGKPPLPDNVIATIQKWIDQGLKLDLLGPKAELETIAAAGRSRKLSHDDLRKVRFSAGDGLWSRAIPDEKPVGDDRGDLRVIGNLPTERLEGLADAAEKIAGRLRDDLAGGDVPLIKGGVVLYAFAKGYDLSSFWQTVLSDERPKGVTGVAGVSGDVVYAAVVPPGSDRGSAADLRAMLAEQMTAAALLGRGVPAWFARGAGRAMAMKTEPKSDLVEAWRRELPASLQRCGSPADFLAGKGDPVSSAVVAGGFVAAIMPSASRLESLVHQLDEGVPFEQAFTGVFRGPPQKLFEAWANQAGSGQTGKGQAGKSPRR